MSRPRRRNTSAPKPDIDLDEAQRFLDVLEPGSVSFTFQTFPDKNDAAQQFALTCVLHGSLNEHSKALASLNRRGAGIFVMVNEGDGKVHPGSKTCRTASNVIRIRAVFVDLDGSPLDPVLKAAVSPSIIVASSPGRWHAYWLLEDCPLDLFKPIQTALADKFSADPKVTDLPRVMRLPGFLHQKRDPFMTKLVDTTEQE
jgi:hypothetical protein